MLNVFAGEGRIVADPEFVPGNEGKNALCKFRVAISRSFKDANGNYESDFFNVVCWRQTAEFVHNYLEKGSPVSFYGRIQTRTYEKSDGSKGYAWEVVAEGVSSPPREKKAVQEEDDPYADPPKQESKPDDDFLKDE